MPTTPTMPTINAGVGNKKSQYFTLDAFIAVMIVVITLVIVLAARTSIPYTAQAELLSKGVIESLSSAKLSDVNNQLVIDLIRNGTITNPDNTILQQVTEFYFTGRKGYASELVKNVTRGLLLPQYSLEVLVNNDKIYSKVTSNENVSTLLTSSKKLVFGVVNRTALFYGPVIAEVRVWQ